MRVVNQGSGQIDMKPKDISGRSQTHLPRPAHEKQRPLPPGLALAVVVNLERRAALDVAGHLALGTDGEDNGAVPLRALHDRRRLPYLYLVADGYALAPLGRPCPERGRRGHMLLERMRSRHRK